MNWTAYLPLLAQPSESQQLDNIVDDTHAIREAVSASFFDRPDVMAILVDLASLVAAFAAIITFFVEIRKRRVRG